MITYEQAINRLAIASEFGNELLELLQSLNKENTSLKEDLLKLRLALGKSMETNSKLADMAAGHAFKEHQEESMEMWVTRDRHGLYIYNMEPTIDKINNYYEIELGKGGDCMALDHDLLPSVTFDNSPRKVRVTLVEE